MVVETPEGHLRLILRKLGILLLVLIAVQFLGAAFYASIEKISFLDALYNVVMLMTAIGSSRDPTTLGGKWFNILLALFSVAMLIGVVTQIGQLLLRREFLTVLQGWRRKSMKDHTVICGTSHTTFEMLNRLPNDKVILIVKTHEDAHRYQHEHPGLTVQIADFTSSQALLKASIEQARVMIACSESDADNAFSCLTAKHIRKDLPVITRMTRTENREKMQEVGADAIISPAELAADAVMGAMEKLANSTASKIL
jgi:voltage-gated potassium channel